MMGNASSGIIGLKDFDSLEALDRIIERAKVHPLILSGSMGRLFGAVKAIDNDMQAIEYVAFLHEQGITELSRDGWFDYIQAEDIIEDAYPVYYTLAIQRDATVIIFYGDPGYDGSRRPVLCIVPFMKGIEQALLNRAIDDGVLQPSDSNSPLLSSDEIKRYLGIEAS